MQSRYAMPAQVLSLRHRGLRHKTENEHTHAASGRPGESALYLLLCFVTLSIYSFVVLPHAIPLANGTLSLSAARE